MKFFIIYALSLIFEVNSTAQVLLINNPSFEGKKSAMWIPWDWYLERDIITGTLSPTFSFNLPDWLNTGSPTETPPDVFTESSAEWQIQAAPHSGKYYVSLVTRPNGTIESITQKLPEPLLAGKYHFTIWTRQSPIFVSETSENGDLLTSFTNPTKLRIGGRNSILKEHDKLDILAETEALNNLHWEEVFLVLNPQKQYRYITIEAFYPNEEVFTAGHILIDDCALTRIE